MFMDQKNQYSENEYTTQNNLQIQCNPSQATVSKHSCQNPSRLTIVQAPHYLVALKLEFAQESTGELAKKKKKKVHF